MKIVALDLGKFKTVACIYVEGKADFITLNTCRKEFAELLKQHAADVVVFETCTAAGWLSDLCEELDQPFFVANPNGEAWKWSTVKRKTDKDDALKLAKLTAMNQLPTVHVPSRATRAKRSLLKFRKSIVTARVKLQNEIRALWQAQGLAPLPAGKCGWTQECLATLTEQSKPLTDCGPADFWRGQLSLHLASFIHIVAQEKAIDRKLDALAKTDESVKRLMTIPGVGRCTAEIICAYMDDPKRFQNGRQVSSYAGLVPQQYQSGQQDRRGRITKRGARILRSAIVECGWLLVRYNGWAQQLMQRLTSGQKTRRKQAIVALGRRLLVRCWAMLRDGTDWSWTPDSPHPVTTPA